MKKSHYSDSQILAIIKQAESGVPIFELCREHRIIGSITSGTKGGGCDHLFNVSLT